jgi:tetratricopeptide (TPR) repeat protein
MIRLNEEYIPSRDEEPIAEDVWEEGELVGFLKWGRPGQKQGAAMRLIAIGAEEALTRCLRNGDPLTVQLATAGLWECWLNEEGPEARCIIELGMHLMESGLFEAACRVFDDLSRQYPGWAEPVNKHASVLYIQGATTDSLELCELVVEMKPNHFAAWHGLALCAVKLRDWETVLRAAQEALRLQPAEKRNRELLHLARARLFAGQR